MALSGTKCPQIQTFSPNETRTIGIDFTGKLRGSDILTGTPIVSISPTGPTLDNEQVNAAIVVIAGRSVAIGKAVLCTITGGTVDTDYIITATCATNATPAEELEATCDLRCRA
jgi:hypothetical protein